MATNTILPRSYRVLCELASFTGVFVQAGHADLYDLGQCESSSDASTVPKPQLTESIEFEGVMNFQAWQRWLVVVGGLIVLLGLAIALLNQTALFDTVFNDRVNPVFWPDGKLPTATKSFQQWIYSVLGATVAGWGTAMTFIAAGPFSRKETWSRNCLALSVAVWFAVDSAISLTFGVGVNVLLNTTLLVAVGVPLLATRRHFLTQ